MKIIVEVSGEFTLTDETGKKLVPNQVMFYFKGTTITFESSDYALAFFTGLRPNGAA